jgi:hypothetical protein
MDESVSPMTREELLAEVQKLRGGPSRPREAGRGRTSVPAPVAPNWSDFFEDCLRHRKALDEQTHDVPAHDVPPSKKPDER